MGYKHPEILVEASWVDENCLKPGVRLIEVDYHPENAYDVGHIRGATLIPWKELIREEAVGKVFGQSWMPGMDTYDDTLPQDIPDEEEFEDLMAAHGIKNDTKVVLYGDHANLFAAYAFWVFKIYCHKDVCLLNGGRQKWEADGREYVTEKVKVEPTKYRVPDSKEETYRVTLDEVYDSLRSKKMQLIDTRSPAEYAGETAMNKDLGLGEMKVRGHIPGAINIPTSKIVNEDGTLKSYEELQEVYRSHGIDPDSDVVAYCRLGERAALTWTVLRYLLGYSNVANYDGSWGEWGTARGVPIKTSAAAAPEAKPAEAKKEADRTKKKKGWGGFGWGKR